MVNDADGEKLFSEFALDESGKGADTSAQVTRGSKIEANIACRYDLDHLTEEKAPALLGRPK